MSGGGQPPEHVGRLSNRVSHHLPLRVRTAGLRLEWGSSWSCSRSIQKRDSISVRPAPIRPRAAHFRASRRRLQRLRSDGLGRVPLAFRACGGATAAACLFTAGRGWPLVRRWAGRRGLLLGVRGATRGVSATLALLRRGRGFAPTADQVHPADAWADHSAREAQRSRRWRRPRSRAAGAARRARRSPTAPRRRRREGGARDPAPAPSRR